MKIRVAIVDDRSPNRISLAEKLNFSEEIEVSFTSANGAAFLDEMKKLSPAQLPQVVLMDIEMPVMNGIETVKTGKQLYPQVKVLMLTVFDDNDKIFEAIKAGASGYLLKDEKIAVIVDYIQQLAEVGGAFMSPRIARKAFDLLMNASLTNKKEDKQSAASKQTELSPRETEVLKLLVDGYDYRAIAEKLFLSTHTVRKHIANIYEKLHVNSKAQVISLAYKNKWLK